MLYLQPASDCLPEHISQFRSPRREEVDHFVGLLVMVVSIPRVFQAASEGVGRGLAPVPDRRHHRTRAARTCKDEYAAAVGAVGGGGGARYRCCSCLIPRPT